MYTIEKIVLGDSDSLASGGFNASHILQPQVPGQSTTDASSSFAFGGLVVGATITYNNLGTSESYESLLFVGPYAPPTGGCPGDVNGDNRTDLTDFSLLAQNFGATGLPHGSGESRTLGDLNDDGSVNLSDFTILAQDFGCVP
ncbi:MAG: dockerin type I domain-containing protein [Planctomycetota bacterium]